MNDKPPSPPCWDDASLKDPHARDDKAERVRGMFDAIAPTYERVNTVASAGRDAYWRRRAVELADVRPDDIVLDVACGTGDFARAFHAGGARRVVGADFAMRMLAMAVGRSRPGMDWCRADALRLPFADRSFSIASCAFGVRNFQDLARGLSEMHRVLRPGGRIVIVEFSMPPRGLRTLYRLYFERILPRIGTLLSGDRSGAYRYLPRSVATFADEAEMIRTLRRIGFESVRGVRLTLGIAVVYLGVRPG